MGLTITRRYAYRAALLLLLTTSSPVVLAASFKCTGSLTKVETIICADPGLSQLDDTLATIYREARKRATSASQLAQAQRQWLTRRNSCVSSDCVRSAYESRIAELGQQVTVRAVADEPQQVGEAAHLFMHCLYVEGKDDGLETTRISSTMDDGSRIAAAKPLTKRFVKGGGAQQSAFFSIESGRVAECIYPSGRSVRIKVGTGSARPYGMCGGDPEIFLSLWVNGRKIESRVWFDGHCYDGPRVTYTVANGFVSKCQSETAAVAKERDGRPRGREETCVRFPDVARYPLDPAEYPPRGVRRPAVGSIEIVWGEHEICALGQKELSNARYWDEAFKEYPPEVPEELGASPSSAGDPLRDAGADVDADAQMDDTQESPVRDLPKELEGASWSTYDFDNDGNIDLVLFAEFMSNYMDSTVLLVKPGKSRKELRIRPSAVTDGAWFLPCQMDAPNIPVKSCPPFSQEHDGTEFSIPARVGTVQFPGRYTHLNPFRFKNKTYVLATSRSEDALDIAAIVEPRPGRKYRPVCLLQRVGENF
jgi:uncharacterized protein YecT (DUF1311 family)